MRAIALSIMFVAFGWSVPREALSQSKKKSAADKTERIEKLDTNGDGKIARDEVSEAVWKRIAAHDTNGDNVLSGEELDSLKGKQSETRRPGGATSAFEVREFQASNKQTLRYILFTPKNIAAAEKLPLVLCLHGAGGNTEAAKVLAAPEQQRKHPCFVAAPACETKQSRWVIGTFRNNPDQRAVEPELMEARATHSEINHAWLRSTAAMRTILACGTSSDGSSCPSWRDVGQDGPPSLNRPRLSSIHETQHAPDFPIPASSPRVVLETLRSAPSHRMGSAVLVDRPHRNERARAGGRG